MIKLNFTEPDYYHREYSNDIGSVPKSKPWSDQTGLERLQRVTGIALPFISLYKPMDFPLSLGMGGLRTISSLSCLASVMKHEERKEITYQLLQTIVAIISLAGTIFAHPLGMIITTGQDLLIDLSKLTEYVQKGDYQKAAETCLSILNNSLYMMLFLHEGLELSIASLGMQIFLGLYHSYDEFEKGNYLEASGHLLMAGIRGKRMHEQINFLQLRREAKRKFEEEKEAELKMLKETVEELRKKLTDESLIKLEELKQNMSAELADNSEILEKQKAQLIDLQQKLLDVQNLQDIMISYGTNPEGLPALHYAIKCQDKKAVKLLLEYGTDPNSASRPPDSVGQNGQVVGGGGPWTALDFAAAHSTPQIIQTLIEHGAEINVSFNSNPNQPWVVARRPSPLHYAVLENKPENIKQLIESGADKYYCIESTVAWGSPIHSASRLGNVAALNLLVQSKSDANFSYDFLNGQRLLPLSSALSHSQAVQFLLESGADPNTGKPQIINGVFISNVPDLSYWVPYEQADLKTLSILLDYGLNINSQTSDGRTLLMNFIKTYESCKAQQNPKLSEDWISSIFAGVEILLKRGANVNEAKDPWGKNALSFSKSPEIKNLLSMYGTNERYRSTQST
ncbi:MAG TPA: ankyrin repeat domain-containing protein [Chlamydiales bacterium]|nr:ankyrin repeat domain-containing protein [Chlamydiales bacterium]